MRIAVHGKSLFRIKNLTDDKQLSLVMSSMVFLLFLTNASAVLEKLTGISHNNITMLIWTFMFLLLVYNLLAIIRNVNIKMLFISIAVGLVFLINYLLLEGNNEAFLYTARRFFLTVFPLIIVVTSIHKYDDLLEQLIKVSKIILPASLLVFIFSLNINQEYKMGFSYSLQLPTVMMLYNFYKTKNWNNLLFVAGGIFTILMLGARGPLLGISFFTGILLFKSLDVRKNALRTTVIVLGFLITAVSSDLILQSMLSFTQSLGIRSRTLFILATNSLHDSGRGYIYNSIIEEIINNPFKMHGVAGEYELTGGLYAHNFILELICDFGIIVGGVIILYIIYQAIKTVFSFIVRGTINDSINIIMFSCSFFATLVSGTVWGSIYLWIWLVLKKERLVVGNRNL